MYEQTLNSMIASWHLAVDELVFQEDLRDNKITYVRLSREHRAEVRHFQLPADLVIRNPITANLDNFVAKHPIRNKQALREKMRDILGS